MFKNLKPSSTMIFLSIGALLLVGIILFIFFGVSSQFQPNLEKARLPVADFSPSANTNELLAGIQSDSSKKLASPEITRTNLQKIIRTGTIRFQVKDYQKSRLAV